MFDRKEKPPITLRDIERRIRHLEYAVILMIALEGRGFLGSVVNFFS